MSTRMPTSPLTVQVYLFGAFRMVRESRPIRLPTRKMESLFAYLILHPTPHPREKLASLFWGDVTDAQARHSLRTATNTLRKVLGSQLLLADRETIQLNAAFPLWVDAKELQLEDMSQSAIEDLKSKVDLYSGDLLAGLYDDWILPDREHYRDQYLHALLYIAHHLRSQSDYAQAIAFAKRVLARDPANERAHQHLIFCHAATGDRAAALKQYEECRRLLQEELAVQPSPETVALYEWISQVPLEAKSREGLITNLPIPLTNFIGRKQEISNIKALLSDEEPARRTPRMLTLIGAGGSGKTRLAIQVATDLIDRFKDGVWWADLAALADEGLVPQTVARALGVRERSNEPVTETLKNYLRPKQLLLLLDNCEHLAGACAQLSQVLLTGCPGLKILATSRESLGLAGETVWHVPTLSVPDPKQPPLTSALSRYDAIRLFCERAAMVKPDFALTEQSAPSTVQLCMQLDGIPLAIELAAARMKVLTVEQIAERLVDRFTLLTGGSRTALPRHQTLRATVDWSYALLSDKEKRLFQRLSVFAGGWTWQAAEAVCSEDEIQKTEVIDLLSRLVDKSLVVTRKDGSQARFRMLETLRQYGAERLEESGEAERIRRRHALYFAGLAEKAEQRLQSPEMAGWTESLEIEHDNMRAALQWSLDHETPETGLRFGGALGIFWSRRGYLREGRIWLESLLARGADAPPQLRAKAMAPAGWLAFAQGDLQQAKTYDEESLAMFRVAGDKRGMVDALNQRGQVAVFQNDYEQALACFGESLEICDEIGYRWGRAWPLLFQGQVQLFMLKWDPHAKTLCEESLQLFREPDDKTRQAHVHIVLGSGAHYERDLDRARAHLEQAVALSRQAGDKAQFTWAILVQSLMMRFRKEFDEALQTAKEGLRSAVEIEDKTTISLGFVFLGMLASATAEMERAARLFGAAAALRDAIGFKLAPMMQNDFHPDEDAARAALGDETFQRAWSEGAAMKMEQAIDYALSTTPQESKGGPR